MLNLLGYTNDQSKEILHQSEASQKCTEIKSCKKNVLRYVDPIASLLGLAQISALKINQDPKISLGVGRLLPKTNESASKEWLPKILQAHELPHSVKSIMHSIDRTWNGDSRDLLTYYNYAIPYAHKLYPTDSLSPEQNEFMREFWAVVSQGLEILEDSYSAELKAPLISKENAESNKTGFSLKLENTIGKTFTAWKNTIKGYCELKVAEPRFSNLFLELEVIRLAKINDQLKDGQEQDKKLNDSEIEEKEIDVKEEKSKLNLLDLALIEIQDKLVINEPLNDVDVKILRDIKYVVNETLNTGSVPKKLHPLSEKARVLWPLKDIKDKIEKIKAIKISTNEINRESDFLRLNEELDRKAVQYMVLVDEVLDEVLTF